MEEIQLIDTIFYFVDTMAEYRQALAENKILSRTIVFVDETCEIYKDGKLFGGYEKFVGQLDDLAQEVRDAMDQSENEVHELVRSLREQVVQQFNDEIDLINRKVTEYKDRLDTLREEFDQGYVEIGEASRDIDEINGILSEYASWKSSVSGTLTTFSRVMDAQSATLRTFGERLDVNEYTVTNYEHLVDLAKQEMREYIENYDINNKVRSIIGREILLQQGLLHDFATITDVSNLTRSSVDTYLNAKEPSWDTIVSKVQGIDDQINVAMSGIDSRITTLNDTLAGMQASVTMFANWYTENHETLAYLKAAADGNSALFDIQAQFNTNDELVASVAARIFGYANSEGSNLVLQADHITMEGTDFRVAVNQVEGLGDWLLGRATVGKLMAGDANSDNIRIDGDTVASGGVYGIKASTGGFYFNLDGSGYVAKGNIVWDSNGNLTIQGSPITPSITNNYHTSTTVFENVYISDYWSKTEFTPTNYLLKTDISPNGDLSFIQNSTLKDWILQQITDTAFGEGTTGIIEETVQTVLRNEISRAGGPFDGFVTDEGLLTTLSAKLYDQNGNVIGEGTLGTALSNLKKMSSALIQNNEVIGLVSQSELSDEVTNQINGNSAISSLTNWAQDVQGSMSSGFNLQALINKLTNSNVADGASNSVRAYIEGIVDDQQSTITISADMINLDGTTNLERALVGTWNQNSQYYNSSLRLTSRGLTFDGYGVEIYLDHTGLSVDGTDEVFYSDTGVEFRLADLSYNYPKISASSSYINIENAGLNVTGNSVFSGQINLVGGVYIKEYNNNNSVGLSFSSDVLNISSDTLISGQLSANSISLTGNESYISVGNDITLSAESSTITTSDLTVNGRSDYTGYAQFYGNARFYSNLISDSGGQLLVNGSISISRPASLIIDGSNGWSGTILTGGTTFTYKKGVLVSVSGTGVSPS